MNVRLLRSLLAGAALLVGGLLSACSALDDASDSEVDDATINGSHEGNDEAGVNVAWLWEPAGKLWDLTYAEDAEVVERVQVNLESGRVTELRYVDDLEGPSRFMHGLVWQAYRQGLGL